MKKKAAGPSVIDRLESLGPEVMDRIDSRMASGESPITVARWVQEDLQQLTDVKLETLKKALHRYLGSELRDKVMARIAAAQRGASQATVLKRLNAMDELEEMVRHQRGRVDKLLMREEQLPGGILLKDTTNEIRLLKDMLVDLGRVQMETGLLPKRRQDHQGHGYRRRRPDQGVRLDRGAGRAVQGNRGAGKCCRPRNLNATR